MTTTLVKEGFVVITPTICQGDVMSWREEDYTGEEIPMVFDTKEEAWKEIAEGLSEGLLQFIDGHRELEHTDFSTDEYVATYQEFDDGSIVVSDEQSNPIIETTLENWREAL